MIRISGHATDGIPQQTEERTAFINNRYSARAGHYDDGRKFVTFKFLNGEIVDTRAGYEIVTLVSKGTEFTQTQKDAIKIFETVSDRKFKAGIPTPFAFSTITPNLCPGKYGQIHNGVELIRRTNKILYYLLFQAGQKIRRNSTWINIFKKQAIPLILVFNL